MFFWALRITQHYLQQQGQRLQHTISSSCSMSKLLIVSQYLPPCDPYYISIFRALSTKNPFRLSNRITCDIIYILYRAAGKAYVSLLLSTRNNLGTLLTNIFAGSKHATQSFFQTVNPQRVYTIPKFLTTMTWALHFSDDVLSSVTIDTIQICPLRLERKLQCPKSKLD